MQWTGRPRLSVLRHGESENNVLDINCATLDKKHLYGLTERGVAQIESVATEKHLVDLILHSPLRRAAETAAILSRAWHVPAIPENLLVEVDLGIFEGRVESDYQTWKRESGVEYHPSGESHEDVGRRVDELLARLDSQYAHASLLLVTHGTLLRHLFLAVYDDIDWSAYSTKYAEGRRVFELQDHIGW